MHPNMHLLHLHVTAVIAPPSPLPPVYVGNPSCKASRPVAERGGWFRLAGSTGKKLLAAVKLWYGRISCLQDLQLPALHL